MLVPIVTVFVFVMRDSFKKSNVQKKKKKQREREKRKEKPPYHRPHYDGRVLKLSAGTEVKIDIEYSSMVADQGWVVQYANAPSVISSPVLVVPISPFASLEGFLGGRRGFSQISESSIVSTTSPPSRDPGIRT